MSTNDKFDALIGQVIDDRYKILSVVGIGGMSVVFKAEDTKEKRVVALKVLNEVTDGDSQAVKRFINESRAISMLSHENIVKVYDMSLKDDLKYIVMELVDGKTLKEYMAERNNCLPFEETVNFIEQILLALEHAHEKGVIHRDIKPHNMIVLPDGKLKVTDFGIAKAPGGDTISMTDKALGTVYYISPEQASGKPTGTYSDIYSVGIMLYEMATGKLPFDADTPVSVAMKQISDEPQKPREIAPSLPEGIEQIILKAISKNPENRFKSARSMLRAVRILKENPMVVFEVKEESASKGGKTVAQNKKKPYRKPAQKTAGKPAKVTFFPIILGIVMAFFSVLVISAIVVIMGLFKAGTSSGDDVIYAEVPDLVGLVYEEEMNEKYLEDHFKIEVVWADRLNDSYGYGEIYNTKPSAGEVKKIKNSTGTTDLILYVNPLEGSALFADYTIMTEAAAKIALRNHGFNNVTVVKSPHDTVLSGYVYDTYPKEGQMASKDDEITLYVSTGKKLQNVIAMPDLVGKTKGQAMIDLKDFEVEFITVPNSSSVGTVVKQSVTPFTVISPEFCDKITLFVSDGNGKTGLDTDSLYLYMPNLEGKELSAASVELEKFISNGIKVVYKPSEESAEIGIIVSQSLEAGSKIMVNYSGEIVIYYGKGIKEPVVPDAPVVPETPVTPDTTEPEETQDEPIVIV